MKKIKYVQLEPLAVLADPDIYSFSQTEFACYWKILMHLYTNNGKLPLDMNQLAKLCYYSDNFEHVWEKIRHKFLIKNETIRHKRVSKELRAAKKRCQVASENGLRGAQKRWQGYSKANGDAIAKENKIKRNESEDKEREIKENEAKVSEEKQSQVNHSQKELRETRITPSVNNISSSLSSITARVSPSPNTKLLYFDDELRKRIPPRNQSDRTAFRNIGNWLQMQVKLGRHDEDIFDAVLDIAEEIANDENVNNQAAVLTSRLKNELNYQP